MKFLYYFKHHLGIIFSLSFLPFPGLFIPILFCTSPKGPLNPSPAPARYMQSVYWEKIPSFKSFEDYSRQQLANDSILFDDSYNNDNNSNEIAKFSPNKGVSPIICPRILIVRT